MKVSRGKPEQKAGNHPEVAASSLERGISPSLLKPQPSTNPIMKFRKMIVLAVAMGAAFSLPAQAQDAGKKGGGRGQMTPEARIQRIEEAVGSLTADQKSTITAIYNKLQSDMQAIPQEERREKGMALMQAAQKDVRAVLTAEQQKKFDEMPAPGRGGPGGPGGPGGGKKKGN